MKTFAVIAALVCPMFAGAAASPAAASASESPATSYAQACGWYAIFACARTPNVTGPGRTIRTDNFPNFPPGYYCRVQGPFGRAEAQRRATAHGGYAKSAC